MPIKGYFTGGAKDWPLRHDPRVSVSPTVEIKCRAYSSYRSHITLRRTASVSPGPCTAA